MKGGDGKKRSESVRERTKIRERIRRAISSKIFNGKRKHDRYGFSDRCDINVILRQLANEVGFVVELDGTTNRLMDFIKCPLCGVCGDVNTIPNDTTIINNGSTMVMGGVDNSSMPSFPLVGGVNTNNIGYPAGIMAIANNDHDTNKVGFYSPIPSTNRFTLVPMYACEDQVALEGGIDDAIYGLGEYCVSTTMGNNGNGNGNGMKNEKIKHQEVLYLEEGINKGNPDQCHGGAYAYA